MDSRIACSILMCAWLAGAGVVDAQDASKEKTSPAATPKEEFTGTWIIDDDGTRTIDIRSLGNGMFGLRSGGWEALGFYDATGYRGVVRSTNRATGPIPRYGTQHGVLQADGTLRVTGRFEGPGGEFEEVWARGSRKVSGRGDRLPAIGEYVYVEELPELITRVDPEFPKVAGRIAEGTVLVQALVGEDGHVRDIKVVKSIPVPDDSVLRAVRQWVFKPAMAHGRPVAVWVAVPVRYTLR
jgi:TonB family protein